MRIVEVNMKDEVSVVDIYSRQVILWHAYACVVCAEVLPRPLFHREGEPCKKLVHTRVQ